MIKVYQTEFGSNGNCFSACLASLLHLDIGKVPNFFEVSDGSTEGWWDAASAWLATKGYGVITLDLNFEGKQNLMEYPGTFIMSGRSPRSNCHHATLWRDGAMIHDPNPLGDGLIEIDSIDLLYPLDPSKLIYQP